MASTTPRRRRGVRGRTVLGFALVAALAPWVPGPAVAPALVAPAVIDHPNVILILTDDQRFDSLFAMPHVRRELMANGVTFDQAIVSNSVCCPSRASILTGGYSHTTHVYTNVYTSWSPYGAWPAFRDAGDEKGTIAATLHEAGYRTALFGKYLNDFNGRHAPVGWDRFSTFVDSPMGGAYYDYSLFERNGDGSHVQRYGSAAADYSTSVIARKALSFLRTTPSTSPFFLYVAPVAPHAATVPAPQDIGTWSGFRQTLRPSFDETDVSDKPGYIRALSPIPEAEIRRHYELQYEALQAVDRMVGAILDELRRSDRLNDTLIVFMSDNGVEFGEHRWTYKLTPYEESIRVPMVVRFDPMTRTLAGTTSEALVSNVDMAPTIADIAGVPFQGVGTVDGVSIAPLLAGTASAVRSGVLLEHIDYPGHYHVPSYCGIRTPGWVYARYDGGWEELYRLRSDPYELNNVADSATDELRTLRARTRALCRPLPPEYRWS